MSEPGLYLVRGGGAPLPAAVDEEEPTNRILRPRARSRHAFLWRATVGGTAILLVLLMLAYLIWLLTEPRR